METIKLKSCTLNPNIETLNPKGHGNFFLDGSNTLVARLSDPDRKALNEGPAVGGTASHKKSLRQLWLV